MRISWSLLRLAQALWSLVYIAAAASTRRASAEDALEAELMPEMSRREEGDSFWLGFVSSMSRSANPWSMGSSEVEAAGGKLHDAVVKPVSTAFMETGAKMLVAAVAVIVALSFCAFVVRRCYASVLTSVLTPPPSHSPSQTSSQVSQSSQQCQTPPVIPPKPTFALRHQRPPYPVDV